MNVQPKRNIPRDQILYLERCLLQETDQGIREGAFRLWEAPRSNMDSSEFIKRNGVDYFITDYERWETV